MPAPLSGEPAWWAKVAVYEAYANRYGWTPDQVNNLPWWVADRLLHVAALRDEVTEAMQRAQQPQHQ